MLNFLDNFIAPLELPGGQEEVQTSLDLPDGEYILTMANNTASPTRYEVVFAWSEDGITWIWRDPGMGLAEWPEGSVIFCGINSHVLQEIFYQLEDFSYQLEDVSHQLSDRKSTRLNSSHVRISYAVFCLKKKKKNKNINYPSKTTYQTTIASLSTFDRKFTGLRRPASYAICFLVIRLIKDTTRRT